MKKSIVSIACLGTFLGATAVCLAQVEFLPASVPQLSDIELLGKRIFFDKRISDPVGQACADCHAPGSGFTGPDSKINAAGSVYPGTVAGRFGNRKPPTAAYGGESPPLQYDPVEMLFVGGMFWDGRATGYATEDPSRGLPADPLADQAMGPFLNPVEQNMPSMEAVCMVVKYSGYAILFEKVWGAGSLDCGAANIYETYKNIARSVAAYERSTEVNPMTSKFDYAEKQLVNLSPFEKFGMELFNGQAMCAACHPAPLFTDFTYDNLGVPKNPLNPFYGMNNVYINGTAINPEGADWIDYGLGGFLESLPDDLNMDDPRYGWKMHAMDNMGKHKVPTLRNVDKKLGRRFVKAYSHNGFFKSLKGIVHFYNTRDAKPTCPPGVETEWDAMNNNCWPMPEVMENVNSDELGNLRLSEGDEWAIVAFLRALDDHYILTRYKPKDRSKKGY